jgi:hypothetical protein
MPAEVLFPLAVRFTLPGGETHHGSLHELPNQELATDLACGLAAATHPHGPIRTRSVARQYVQTVRRCVRELHREGFTGGLATLSTAMLVQYWLTCDFHRERRLRAVLGAYQEQVGGLAEGIVAHLAGRRINAITKSRPNPPYSETEWQRLARACISMISAAERAQHRALEAADRGSDPDSVGAGGDELARLLLDAGPMSVTAVGERLGYGLERARILTVHRALFPPAETALAYLTLFAMRTGIVPDGIDALRIGDITRTSPETVLLSYRKGRTGIEALNLPRNAVGLLDRWLGHSALLRGHAGDLASRLWIHTGGRAGGRFIDRVFAAPRTQARRSAWVAQAGVLGDDGATLPLHGGRIRATYHHRRDRSTWTGRATIDPNHTARVEGDHYLSSHTPAQLDALEGIIESAQGDLRRKAAPPVIATSADAAEFTAAFPALVGRAGLETSTIRALLSGEQDVFVAACADPLHSPHAPAGVLCPARPWVCLLCPLAAFAPRHLPNLLRLKEYFTAQAHQMSTTAFLQVFGPYAARLDEDILPRFGAAAIETATRELAETEPEDEVGLPLRLEEHPR